MKKLFLFLLLFCLTMSVFANEQKLIVPADAKIDASQTARRSILEKNVDFTVDFGRNREVLFNQTLEEVDWSFGVSDANSTGPYYQADNFFDVVGTITGVSFTGLCLSYSGGWAASDEDPMTFDINFYADNAGAMGDLVVTHEVTLDRVATGQQFSGFDAFTWTGDLPAGVQMAEGWISIVGTSISTPTDGWLLWGNSPDGDLLEYADDGTGWAVNTDPIPDRCFTLTGTVAAPLSPAAPSDFVAIPDAGGALSCDLSWTNPSLDYAGNVLTDLDEINLYRGTELIYTDSAPLIGEPASYEDVSVPASGTYSYSVVGVNDSGEGVSANAGPVWIGEDIPNTVTDVLLTDVSVGGDLIAQLGWINPTTGLNGGPFNEPILGYHIVRSDMVEFELTGVLTEWTDETLTVTDYYSYSITAYNSVGDGATAISNTEWIGDAFSGIVIIDLETVTPTGATLQASLESNYAGAVVLTNDIYAYPLTSEVDAVFILLGIYSDNAQILLGEETPIVAYINGGGNVYLEGGDSWYWDPQYGAFDFGPLFGITSLEDGSSDLTTVDGADFFAGMTWSYSGENSFIDRLAPIAPAVTVFSNTAVGYDCGIAYDSGTYRTIGTSFEITGLGGANTLDEAVQGIMEFFDIGDHGEVDGIVTDSVTSNPIEGVEVFVGNWGPVFTDAAGAYLIEDVITGTREVTAFKEGYYDFIGEVDVEADITVTYDFAMDPLEFATLDGTVTDLDTGDLIEGAEISMVSVLGYTYDAVTIADGTYSIVDIVADTYDITCTAAMHIPENIMGITFDAGAAITQDFVLGLSISYFSDFEDNDGYLLSSDPMCWQWGAPTVGPGAAYSGNNVWGTGLDANYPNSSNATLDMTIPVGVVTSAYILEFWHWYDTEASWDGGNVKISIDNGANWSVLTPNTPYPGTANASNPLNGEPIYCGHDQGFWELAQFDLAAYVGENILIRWHFGSDSSVDYPGWYIDDVAISEDGGSSFDPVEVVPIYTELLGNYPNPFNPSTKINFSLKDDSMVSLQIYNIKGQLVKSLVNELKEAGDYTISWNGTDNSNKSVSSGVYFYKMKTQNYNSTKKMILMK